MLKRRPPEYRPFPGFGRHGRSSGDAEEAAAKRALIARAGETVVLATGDKLGAVSPYRIAGLDEVATLVVEADVAAMAAKGVSVVRAGQV